MNAKTLLSVALAAACSLFSTALCATTTYYVAPGDPVGGGSGTEADPFHHPQTAIDLADGTEPVVVKIAAGTYKVKNAEVDPSVINIAANNITLEALSPRQVIIDAEKWAKNDSRLATKTINRAVRVASGLTGVRLVGLVFQGGSGADFFSWQKSVYIASCALADAGLFENCEFWGYHYYYLDAIAFRGTAVASNCLFTAYTKGQSGTSVGGEYTLAVSGSAELHDSIVENCYWDMERQKKIYPMSLSGSAIVSNCVIRNNTSGSPYSILTKGFGYHTEVGTVVMSGGTLVDTVVTNNLYYGNAGGVYVTANAAVIKDCILWGNRATGEGDNLRIKAGVTPTITGTTIEGFGDDDANGNTSFEPYQEFCTSNSVSVGKAPFTVRFRNRTKDASAVWDFGDGSATVTGAEPEHTYTAVGAYTVKMTLGGKTKTRPNYIVALGDTVCVAKTGTATPPYDTYAKGLTHPQDAIDLLPANSGVTISIDDGKYTVRNLSDTSVLSIGKDGVTLKARNGNGHVWIDSQRTCGADASSTTSRALVRRNISIGGGISDVLVDGLVMTNGWTYYNVDGGTSCALMGSGVFTNCTFDLYCYQWSIAATIGGQAHLTHCALGAANGTQKKIYSSKDYGISLSGSAVLDTCDLFGLNLTKDQKYLDPYVYISSANAVMRNCLVRNFKGQGLNTSGAIYATAGTIENCTIVNNSVTGGKGGGVWLTSPSVVFRNNIVWGNTAPEGNNIYATDYSGCTYSAATELDATAANHNVKLTLNDDPGFTAYASGDYSLKVKTLLTGAGDVQDWMEEAHDMAGNPRLFKDSVSMGCYEPQGRDTSLTGDFSVSGAGFGKPPYEATFASTVSGGTGTYLYKWDFGDGTVTDFIDNGAPTHTYTSVSGYNVTLTVTDGVITNTLGTKANLVVAVGDICYVRPDQDGTPPYDTWEKATSNLEAAVNLQPNEVIVTNGTYLLKNIMDANGILLDRALTLRSVEGAEKTTILANPAAVVTRDEEFHNVTLKHADAVVDGFTLRGAVPPAVVASAGLVKNCVVTNTRSTFKAELVRLSGTAVFSNCLMNATGAEFKDDQASYTMLTAGGNALVVNSEFCNLNQSATGRHPIAPRSGMILNENSTARNCYVHDVCYALAGGPQYSDPSLGMAGIYVTENATADCCTVTRCWSKYKPGGGINATAGATVRNCIVYGNTGYGTKQGTGDEAFDIRGGLTPKVFANNLVGVSADSALPATATGCLPLGTDPQFVTNGPSYRIERTSPCVDAGTKLEWCRRRGVAVDIEGQERRRQQPDIGCYEVPRDLGMLLLVR